MLARISSLFFFILFALPLLVAASAIVPRTDGGGGGGSTNQCNTGSISCCDQTASSTSTEVTALAALLGVVLGPITQLVGLGCTSVVGGDSCSQQAVCCTGNNFKGLLVLGCSPININV